MNCYSRLQTNAKWVFLLIMLFFSATLKAQLEGAYLKSRDFSGFGGGGFLNLAIPVPSGNFITVEGGAYYFGNSNDDHVALIPVLLGYRLMLNTNSSGYYDDEGSSGFYVEPVAGYTFGGTDIQRTDALGQPVTNSSGDYVDEAAKGPTAGLVFGYIFTGRLAFTIGLRYEHVFVSPDPTLNMFSLRISHTLSLGFLRRE